MPHYQPQRMELLISVRDRSGVAAPHDAAVRIRKSAGDIGGAERMAAVHFKRDVGAGAYQIELPPLGCAVKI